jgi:hypothetical protein
MTHGAQARRHGSTGPYGSGSIAMRSFVVSRGTSLTLETILVLLLGLG